MRDTPWAPCLCQRRWLEDEHKDKKEGLPYNTSEWTEVVWKPGETPQQRNGSDCGVFMTRTAEYLARGAWPDFTQRDMPYFRRRMVLELVRTSLRP